MERELVERRGSRENKGSKPRGHLRKKPSHHPKRKSEVQRLTCDARFCMSLGWKHKIDINNGLKLNIEWALRNWKKK